MSELPKLLNSPFAIQIGETSLLVKRAGIFDLAELQDYIDSQSASPLARDERILPHAIYLCAKKVYPDISEEYINDLLPATFVMGNPKIATDLLVKLGFILPPKPQKETLGTEAKQ